MDKLSETEHVYKIEILNHVKYGPFAFFTCVNHPQNEYGFGGCSKFQALLQPEPAETPWDISGLHILRVELAISKYIADHGCNEEWDKDYIRGLFKAIDIVKGLQK